MMGQIWKIAILAAALGTCTVHADDPAELPEPAKVDSVAPAVHHGDVKQKAAPLPPPRVVDLQRQTIDWHARPRVATTLPQPPAAEGDGEIRTAAAQVPTGPPLVTEPNAVALPHDLFNYDAACGTRVEFDGVFRGYYRNDQRIYWSGVETVLGAEGVFRPLVQSTNGPWTVSAQGEFFINQKYGSSILSDSQRDLYRANFQIDPFEVFQLYGQVQYGDWLMRIGKSRTPFGSYQGPTFTNSLVDAPFIRTEVIPWTETGLFIRWQPGPWSVDVAVTNGEPNLDTNSAKAGIARVGYVGDFWTAGASVKRQDGISSEIQKRYNNIYGFDYSLRFGRVVVYGEVTYDEYGFRRDYDALTPNPYTLGVRSLYHREIFSGTAYTPAHGVGYYIGLGYRGDRWTWDATFGTYFPQQLGVPAQDANIHRGVIKAAYSVAPNFQIYAIGIVENVRPPDGVLYNDNPYAIIFGVQMTF